MGLVVGVLANLLVHGCIPGRIFGTIGGGIVGAFLGGAIFSLIAGRGVRGFDLVSLVIAFVGAALLLTILRKAGLAEPKPRWKPKPRV